MVLMVVWGRKRIRPALSSHINIPNIWFNNTTSFIKVQNLWRKSSLDCLRRHQIYSRQKQWPHHSAFFMRDCCQEQSSGFCWKLHIDGLAGAYRLLDDATRDGGVGGPPVSTPGLWLSGSTRSSCGGFVCTFWNLFWKDLKVWNTGQVEVVCL